MNICHILLFSVLLGCGPAQVNSYPSAEVEEYVNEFIQRGLATNNDHYSFLEDSFINIDFEDESYFEGNIVGVCDYDEEKISLRKKYWDNITISERKELLFHELGHCWLHQDHRPNSIMSEYMLNTGEFHNNYHWYMDELFYFNLK